MKLLLKFFQFFFAFFVLAVGSRWAHAETPLSLRPQVCPRFSEGGGLHSPVDLFSQNGRLVVQMFYQSEVDSSGRQLYCFLLADGQSSPTLHLHPGDHLVLTLQNDTPLGSPLPSMHMSPSPADVCGDSMMDTSSVNLHFHGTNSESVCHQDEVLHTVINSGHSFTYDLVIPKDEPPGMYWYHPHVHGMSEAAVLGGASGALIVDGIEQVQPAVRDLRQQILVVRDHLAPLPSSAGSSPPAWELSVNHTDLLFPDYVPPTLSLPPLQKQFWRVLNASADTILNLQLRYDDVPQEVELVALDGVALGLFDSKIPVQIVRKKELLLSPGARAEFILTGPANEKAKAQLVTLKVDTGPIGDNDPFRPLLNLKVSSGGPLTSKSADTLKAPKQIQTLPPLPSRFDGLPSAKPTAVRKIYFSEVLSDPSNPSAPTDFFITVEGAKPAVFDSEAPPAVTTTQGAVEDWTVENRSGENHEFHIHQIHFLLMERNGVPVSLQDRQLLDVVDVPFWKGSGPYPSVKLRMDFRRSPVGDFVYHCHILGHEDKGMMAVIRVLPR